MPITIKINDLTLVHKASEGVSTADIPDLCKSPTVPLPHGNVAFSADLAKGTTSVFADGGNMCANFGSEFARSSGDEGGGGGGIVSGVFLSVASWITCSFDVKFEAKGVNRLTDKMLHNNSNTVNLSGELQKNLVVQCSIKDLLDNIKKCPKAAAILKNAEKTLGRTPNISFGEVPGGQGGHTDANGNITLKSGGDCRRPHWI